MQKYGRKLLHIGLALMALGLIGLYGVLALTGLNVGHWDLAVPNLIGGAGMGMVFVPLFDINTEATPGRAVVRTSAVPQFPQALVCLIVR